MCLGSQQVCDPGKRRQGFREGGGKGKPECMTMRIWMTGSVWLSCVCNYFRFVCVCFYSFA